MLRPLPRTQAPLGAEGAEVLRLITQRRFPVRLTVHASGRRRYGYWLPLDPATGRGGCYVALSTGECDALHAAGRIVLGDPLVDPAKTTYPVQAAARAAAPAASAPRVSLTRAALNREILARDALTA
ncbi:hypothetical protein [Streptomyces sp. NBC_00358]|uniref:hypothetical protein n=1 Tax=Streptomyces sp. NBC_00358 TaxID=2975725 RepID=UPI002E272AE5